MHVRLHRVGGVAGLNVMTDLDSSHLSEADARRLDELVENAPWTAFAAAATPGAFDVCQYTLTVKGGKRARSLCVNDLALPLEVDELMAFVIKHGRPAGPTRR